MQLWLIPMLVVLALSACRSSTLSERECHKIEERTFSYMMRTIPSVREAVKSGTWPRDKPDRTVLMCTTGSLYTRKDYECIVAATSDEQLSACLVAAHEKLP